MKVPKLKKPTWKKFYKPAIYSFIALVVFWYLFENTFHKATSYGVYKVNKFYHEPLVDICKKHKAPINYFKALILLETSASPKPKNRYEPKVFTRLLNVKKRRSPREYGVTYELIKDKTNEEIKALATSWGPLQLMGFHALRSDFTIEDLQGDKALEKSVEWCMREYGHMLRKKQFDDAFHYHNTGKIFPRFNILARTFDPNYVRTGKAYMKMLRKKEFLQNKGKI